MAGLAAIAVGAILLTPHDGPARRIALLTKRMAKVGQTAELLFQRAVCRVELRHHRTALIDLDGALELDPRHEGALVERVRVFVSLRKPKAALTAAHKARSVLRTPAFRALLARVEADILTAQKRFREAIPRLEAALRASPNQPGVILHRSVLRGLLGQRDLRRRELQLLVEPTDVTGPISPIVEAAWIDALIDSGRFERARKIVQIRLRESRFQSAWLVERARIHIGEGKREQAEADLLKALRELTARIRPENPDLLLVADRAIVLHLLGREKAARGDVELLRARRYPALLQLRLQLIIGG